MGIDQLVNAYKGNPAPLQAKVQQAQQSQPPGAIPPDLEEAIALQKITELRNSAQAQQAMQAGGAQPSVVEKLRQMLSAEQRQQAQPPQMPQMPQMPQGPQGGPPQGAQGQPPQGAPQPPQPPQGQPPAMAARGGSIADLMSNVGRHYAEGGIIGNVRHFDNGDLVVDPMGGVISSSKTPTDDLTFFERIGLFNPENRRANERAERAQREREAEEIRRAALGLKPGEVENNRLPDPRSKAYRFPDAETQLAEAAAFSNPKPRVNANTGMGGGGGGGGSTTSNAPQNLTFKPSEGGGRDYERKLLARDEDALAGELRAKFLNEVGKKDVSIYDEMAAELKARKERLKGPEKGFDSLMEYLGQIAQSGGGRNWMEAGVKGAAGLSALQKSRQDQQDALVDKILDLGAKKREAEYGERLSLFNLTKAEKDKIIQDKKAVAQSLGLSEDEERKLIQQSLENELNRKAQIRAASVGRSDNLMERAAAIRSENPGMTIEESIRRAALAGGAASVEGTNARTSKAYIDAKNKIDERFQHLISDTPYGKKQKELYDKAIADLDKTFNVSGGSGINTLPVSAQAIPAGAKPSDLTTGAVYQTARGPAKWNGKAFEPVQ